jgi:glycoprotein endo-alpha-1,2-mannosidase
VLRRLTLAIALSLALPASAAALPGQTSIFYYPWYSTPQVTASTSTGVGAGTFRRSGARLVLELGSGVLQAHMREIAAAGVGEVISSWWGAGSLEDQRLPAVIEAARAQGLRFATQLEPYDEGRTPTSVAADIARLRDLGIARIYVYRPSTSTLSPGGSSPRRQAACSSSRRRRTSRGRLRRASPGSTRTTSSPTRAASSGGWAHAPTPRSSCAPSGPGYDALRANGTRIRPRRDGATYDSMWGAAIRAKADVVTITSYNERHGGTQIEPARTARSRAPTIAPIRPSYGSYNGAYGRRGKAAETA